MQEESPQDGERRGLSPPELIASLKQEELMLIRIRDELYDGSWSVMQHDLKNRLHGKPYLFKLVSRIEHDLEAIDFLAAYEERMAVNLSDFTQ